MEDVASLIAKLERIEALHAGASTEGERIAAEEARLRIRMKIDRLAAETPVVELRFAIHNPWSRQLFTSLLRRYGVQPYRYPRQKRQTIMAKLPESAVGDLWREFCELDDALRGHLDQLAMAIIARAISPDISEAAEVRELGELG